MLADKGEMWKGQGCVQQGQRFISGGQRTLIFQNDTWITGCISESQTNIF